MRLLNSPNVSVSLMRWLTSGCMKRANVSLDTYSASVPAPTRTQWGVARSLPAVASSRASPVWKARQSGGIVTFVNSPQRAWMYSPDEGEGEGIAFAGIPGRFSMYSAYRIRVI